ncbi:MAG: murein hydrolase activator EnvC family protein [Pseudomonadota bacterium]
MRRNPAFGALAGLALLLPLTPAAEEDLSRADLEKLRDRIETAREEAEAVAGRKDAAESELADAEAALTRAARRLNRTASALQATRERLAALRSRREAVRDDLGEERDALAAEIRALYTAGGNSTLRLLLSQGDPRAVGRTLVWGDYLARARQARIGDFGDSLEELDDLAQRIARREQELERRDAEVRQRRDELAARQSEYRRTVARLDDRLTDRREQVADLEAREDRLESLLGELDDPEQAGERVDLAQRRGGLPWPARGPLRAAFGSERQSGLTWKGIFIAHSAGDPVSAVAPGRVVFADWMRGYGQLLILDHGHGFMSLYGHNRALLAELGDWVEAGDTLARVGQSGPYEESGLYFELRRQGRPQDPVAWLGPR